MKIPPHSVQSRLVKWGHWVQDPASKIAARSSSPFGRIADERNAAGNHGDGIRYEIIDGVPCPPDGGLGREMEARAKAWGFDIRCREVNEAVGSLPDGMRRVVVNTYVVPEKQKPRSFREVAARLDLHCTTVEESLNRAHQRISDRIWGAFEIVAEADMPETSDDDGESPETLVSTRS